MMSFSRKEILFIFHLAGSKYLFKMGHTRPLSPYCVFYWIWTSCDWRDCAISCAKTFIFGFFNQILEFLQQYNVKCPSSIRCWDSNSQPLVHESPPITTRLGLPSHTTVYFLSAKVHECFLNLHIITCMVVKMEQ